MKMGSGKLFIPNAYPKNLVVLYLEKLSERYCDFKSTNILGALELATIELKVLNKGNR